MAACLKRQSTNYLDMAAAGPRDVVGTADVDEEIAMDAEFKKKGLTALVFFGIDPGTSDVFARALYDQFDSLERLTVLDGDNSSVDGVDFAPSFFADHDGRGVPHPAAACLRGRQDDPASVAQHDPGVRLPGPGRQAQGVERRPRRGPAHADFLGDKGLRDADFFIALDEQWVNLMLTWRKLGFDHNKEIEFEGARFRPLDLLVSRLPKAVDLIGRMHGSVFVGALAEGTIAGKRVRRFMYQITSHDEAFQAMGVQGTGYQTGIPAACGALLLAKGIVTRGQASSPPSRSTQRRSSSSSHSTARPGE